MKTNLLIQFTAAVLLILTYSLRPDSLAAITIFPSWAWLGLLIPTLPFLRRRHIRLSLLPLAAWLTYVVMHVEEPRSFARGIIYPINEEKAPTSLRLVSMNCGGGLDTPLNELFDLQPDIIFLQEPPSRQHIELFTGELFGDNGQFIYDADTCIIARGRLTSAKSTVSSIFYSYGALELQEVGTLHLISLRLRTGSTRLDLWNPNTWSEHKAQRILQRNQLQEIITAVGTHDTMIIAGDFNAPQGDGIFSILRTHFFDTFRTSGKGFGNTIINDIPVLRIDQIWVSFDFVALQSFSRKSMYSDHRFVISDIKIKDTQHVPPGDTR